MISDLSRDESGVFSSYFIDRDCLYELRREKKREKTKQNETKHESM